MYWIQKITFLLNTDTLCTLILCYCIYIYSLYIKYITLNYITFSNIYKTYVTLFSQGHTFSWRHEVPYSPFLYF